jgi:hypothetical protein
VPDHGLARPRRRAPSTACRETLNQQRDSQIKWTEAEGWPLHSGTLVGPEAVVDGVFMRLGRSGRTSPSMSRSWSPGAAPWSASAPPPGTATAPASPPKSGSRTWTLASERSRGSGNMSTPPRSATSSTERPAGAACRPWRRPRSSRRQPPGPAGQLVSDGRAVTLLRTHADRGVADLPGQASSPRGTGLAGCSGASSRCAAAPKPSPMVSHSVALIPSDARRNW